LVDSYVNYGLLHRLNCNKSACTCQ
jgi:hypothetical protein